ncbi:MAG: tetratricopeptide repeat protein [Acidobacteriia bacterium]|nr:tetratricopeptide repeat protein [Terriglobia bacterium]
MREARAALRSGRFELAEQTVRMYLAAHPASPEAQYLLGFILFRRDRPRESLAAFTRAAAIQKPSAAALKIVGLDYALLGDYPDAIKWLEQSAAGDPRDAEAAYHLGRVCYLQNLFDRSLAAFQRALEIDPRYGKAENNLGLAYAARNESERAEAAYRKAMEIDRANGAPSQEPYINLAELLLGENRASDAPAILDAAAAIRPKSDRFGEVRGRVFLSLGRMAEAEAALRDALAAQPESGALHYQLARALKGQGKAEDAAREFARCQALLAAHAPAPNLALRASARAAAADALASGDKERAMAIAQSARDAAPGDSGVLYEFALVAMSSSLYEDARLALEHALEIQPEYPDARYALARTYLAQSKPQLAEAQMRLYLAARPQDATAQYGLGYILAAEQKTAEAKTCFEKSLALQPRQAESLFELGEIALREGRADDAARRFREALSFNPAHAGALAGLGIIAYRAKEYLTAEKQLAGSVRSAPSFQKAHYYYGLTLSKLGRKAEADREFALAKSPGTDSGAAGLEPVRAASK